MRKAGTLKQNKRYNTPDCLTEVYVILQMQCTEISIHIVVSRLVPVCNIVFLQQIIAEALLTNRMGRACRQLIVNRGSGINTSLQEVLVHYSIILRCKDCTPAIESFWQMMHQTNQMQVG